MLYGRTSTERILYENPAQVHILPKQHNSAKIIRLALPYHERLIMQVDVVELSNESSERNHINKQIEIKRALLIAFSE